MMRRMPCLQKQIGSVCFIDMYSMKRYMENVSAPGKKQENDRVEQRAKQMPLPTFLRLSNFTSSSQATTYSN